jgi:sugar phosphate isomerase/epimerase
MNVMNRRCFVRAAAFGATAMFAMPARRLVAMAPGEVESRVAFNTANLVARFTNYRFELKHWGEQHQKTVAMTDEAAWAAICREIAAAGFKAVEIWEAHAAPESLNRTKALQWKRILDDHGLRPIAYAGGLRPETLEICQWLGVPHLDGGLRGQAPEEASRLCREAGVRFNLENHPEKTAKEALAKIGGGDDWLGLCVDTGWFGTQGADVAAEIRAAGRFVRHTHIKDVKAAGGHETCLLGEGVVKVEDCLRALVEIGYGGWYAWEDEPEDRNPFDSAVRNREWMESRLRAAVKGGGSREQAVLGEGVRRREGS